MATINQLHTHVVIFRRSPEAQWEQGIRTRRDNDIKGVKDLIIDFECKPVKEIWDLNDQCSQGSFIISKYESNK